MPTQYAGSSAAFPGDYTIPDASSPPTASAFNVAAEALGDRTAWLKVRADWLAQLQPLNVGAEIIPSGITGSPGLRGAFYDAKVGRWLFCGDAKELRGAYNITAPDTSTRMTVGTTSDNLFGGAVDPTSGAMVVSISGQNAIDYSSDGGTSWTQVTAIGGAGAYTTGDTTPRVLWTGSQWFWRGGISGDQLIAASTSGSSWSTPAASATQVGGDHTCIGMNGSRIGIGRIYTNAVYFSYTDDAGATLSAAATIAHSLTAVDQLSLNYLTASSEWLLTIADSTARKSEVWVSADNGVTWTKRTSLATAALMGDIASYGSTNGALLIGAARTTALPSLSLDDIVYSPDAGVTWKTNRQRLSGTCKGAFVGDGRVVFVTSTGYWPALVVGDPAIALT